MSSGASCEGVSGLSKLFSTVHVATTHLHSSSQQLETGRMRSVSSLSLSSPCGILLQSFQILLILGSPVGPGDTFKRWEASPLTFDRRYPAVFLVRCYYHSSRFAPTDVTATTASASRCCRARQHRAQSLPADDCSGGSLQSHTRSTAAAAAAVAAAGACAAGGAAGAD